MVYVIDLEGYVCPSKVGHMWMTCVLIRVLIYKILFFNLGKFKKCVNHTMLVIVYHVT
jgi:hypothetical protein